MGAPTCGLRSLCQHVGVPCSPTWDGPPRFVRFDLPIRAAAEVNLMEEDPQQLAIAGGAVSLSFRPFEIKTLRLQV